MLPLSLYIHTPWCVQKCPYCDFNSHKSPNTLPESSYIQALIADLEEDVRHFPNHRLIQSIFIGGGTPSLLSAEAYETLFTALKKHLIFAPHIEITLEANPGTVEQQRFKDYLAIGINRLSLGIQSFNPIHLKKLGRIHNDKEAHKAIECARNAGFNNINLDLMHGLPEQSVQEGLNDLRAALAHEPEHLSWYQLTLEPNTIFYKNPPKLPSEEKVHQLETTGFDLLQKQGFERYEISAFCRHQKYAQHNLNYWLFGDYYGIGAGAHGKLSKLDDQSITRTRKYRQPHDYLNIEKPYLAEQTTLSTKDRRFEFMLNTTRLTQPITLDLWTERTGLEPSELTPYLEQAKARQLIEDAPNGWMVTELGRRFSNDLQAIFL